VHTKGAIDAVTGRIFWLAQDQLGAHNAQWLAPDTMAVGCQAAGAQLHKQFNVVAAPTVICIAFVLSVVQKEPCSISCCSSAILLNTATFSTKGTAHWYFPCNPYRKQRFLGIIYYIFVLYNSSTLCSLWICVGNVDKYEFSKE